MGRATSFLPLKYVKTLRKAGWTWRVNGRSHIEWTGPEGQKVCTPSSTSDWRAFENALRTFRHAGIDLKRRRS